MQTATSSQPQPQPQLNLVDLIHARQEEDAEALRWAAERVVGCETDEWFRRHEGQTMTVRVASRPASRPLTFTDRARARHVLAALRVAGIRWTITRTVH